jgi:hypothetical protein
MVKLKLSREDLNPPLPKKRWYQNSYTEMDLLQLLPPEAGLANMELEKGIAKVSFILRYPTFLAEKQDPRLNQVKQAFQRALGEVYQFLLHEGIGQPIPKAQKDPQQKGTGRSNYSIGVIYTISVNLLS